MASSFLIIHLATLIAIYAILALSLNLILGVTGLFDMGHAAFFGIGAYTTAILTTDLRIAWLPAMLASIVMAAFFAWLTGIPTLKLRGDYFAVVTMAVGEIARNVFQNWMDVTRGPLGIPNIPGVDIFGLQFPQGLPFLGLSFIFLAITFFICQRLIFSPFGRILKGIREDEGAGVEALGKNSYLSKIYIFVIGSAMAGLAGSLFATYIGYIDPSTFILWLTDFIILIIMLGGKGNSIGSVIASVLFVVLREGTRFLGLPTSIAAPLQQWIFGLLLILVTLFAQKGLFPEKTERWNISPSAPSSPAPKPKPIEEFYIAPK
jgi:branched-chain amino acid transport system permease protein